jgi:hypothetical protein
VRGRVEDEKKGMSCSDETNAKPDQQQATNLRKPPLAHYM